MYKYKCQYLKNFIVKNSHQNWNHCTKDIVNQVSHSRQQKLCSPGNLPGNNLIYSPVNIYLDKHKGPIYLQ